MNFIQLELIIIMYIASIEKFNVDLTTNGNKYYDVCAQINTLELNALSMVDQRSKDYRVFSELLDHL